MTMRLALIVSLSVAVLAACGETTVTRSEPTPVSPLAATPTPVARVIQEETPVAVLTTKFRLTWTVIPSGSGSIAVSPARINNEYENGEEVRLRAIASEGFEFKGWEGDLSGSESPQPIVMDRDRTVVAVFEPTTSAPKAAAAPTATPVPTQIAKPTLIHTPTPTRMPTPTPALVAEESLRVLEISPLDGSTLTVGKEVSVDAEIEVRLASNEIRLVQLAYEFPFGTANAFAEVKVERSGAIKIKGRFVVPDGTHTRLSALLVAPDGPPILINQLAAFYPISRDVSKEASTITGRLLFDGQPITEYTQRSPIFEIQKLPRDQTSCDNVSTPLERPSLDYDKSTGEYVLAGLQPGDYCVGVGIDASEPFSAITSLAGDYVKLRDKATLEGGVETLDFDLIKVIHLTNPIDNSDLMPTGFVPTHESPFKAVWERVPEAARYDVSVMLCQTPAMCQATVSRAATQQNSFEVDVPPNEEGTHYLLQVRAINELNESIGLVLVTSLNSVSAYWFKQAPTISGRLLFNDEPITKYTQRVPIFEFKGRDAGQTCQGVHRLPWARLISQYDVDAGVYSVEDMSPGSYCIRAMIDAAEPFSKTTPFAGDYLTYESFFGFPVRVVAGESKKLDLRLERAIRLQSPIDNTDIFPETPFAKYQSPLSVEWEPLSEAVKYNINVLVVDVGGFGLSTALEGSTRLNSINLELPPHKSGEHYGLLIEAVSELGDPVGRLFTNGWNPGYDFSIKATDTSPPTTTPTLSRIAFVSNRDGNNEIYIMNADGSKPTRLTLDAADDLRPFISPDGTKIAFTSHRDDNAEVYVMNTDGTDITRLTNNPVRDETAGWSPDGKIAFDSDRDGREIWLIEPDGSNLKRLTSHRAHEPISWSPDGNQVTFHSDRDGLEEIYLMNSDGQGVIRLTNSPSVDWYPAWSPDGTRIAFQSNREGNDEIYAIILDGLQEVNLTNDGRNDQAPSWSPDGTKIAFTSDRAGNREIYVMNTDGTRPVNVTDDPADDFWPSWSP